MRISKEYFFANFRILVMTTDCDFNTILDKITEWKSFCTLN